MLINTIKSIIGDRQAKIVHDDLNKGLILGIGHKITDESKKMVVSIPWDTLNRHAYLLGSTGSGKSVFLRNTVTQLIRNGYGVMFIDMKGENEIMWDMWRACVDTDRKEDFIYFSPVLSEKFSTITAQWNPLVSGDANVVTSRLMDAFGNDDPSAQFYEKVKYDILFSVVSCMKAIGKVFTMQDIVYALSDVSAMKKLHGLTPDCQGKKMLMSVIKDWEENPKVFITYIKGTKVAVQEVATGLSGTVCNSINPTLNLGAAVEKKKAVYVYLPTMYAKDAMRAIGKMMLSELKNVFADIQAFSEQTGKFAIVVDEFEELAFKAVKDIFNKARSAGVSMIIGHQTQSDLHYETKSTHFADSLLDNTASKLIMQIKSRDSAEKLAGIIGEMPSVPFVSKYVKQKYIVPPEVLCGKNEIYENGLAVGEMIAKIDADIYRVNVPYPKERENRIPGRDLPKPIHEYKQYAFGEPLNLGKAAK